MKPICRIINQTEVEPRFGLYPGSAHIEIRVPFLDHMINTFAPYAGVELSVVAQGARTAFD